MTQWKYAHFVFDLSSNEAEVSDGVKLNWQQLWQYFDMLGSKGWEMITAVPMSDDTGFTHSAGDVTKFFFVFKRRV